MNTKTFVSRVFAVMPDGPVPVLEDFSVQCENVDQARMAMMALAPEFRKSLHLADSVPLQFVTKEAA